MIPLRSMHAYLPDTQLGGTPLTGGSWGLLTCKAVGVLVFSLFFKFISVPWSVGLERLGLVVLWGWHKCYSATGRWEIVKERALPGLEVMCCVMCEGSTQGKAAASKSWQITAQKTPGVLQCSV